MRAANSRHATGWPWIGTIVSTSSFSRCTDLAQVFWVTAS
jgi:hypothetical protein